ncbi:MAG: SWI/SNF-related matrix-associated actin-dependent regulator of chromatin subfamily A-like protein 1, partial [Marteilia pararefringens]
MESDKCRIIMSLFDSNSFSINFQSPATCSSKQQIYIDICRSVKDFKYDPFTRSWRFDLEVYAKLVGEFLRHHNELILDRFPENLAKQICISREKERIITRTIDLDSILRKYPKILKSLYEFQKQALIKAISFEGRILIADDMGLGKTLQAITIALYYSKDWPLLIICPSSLKYCWKS